MSETEQQKDYDIVAPSALEALQRAEVDIAVTTAKRYPRDISQSIKTCRQLALRDATVAAACNYVVPRGGKKLVGPSVHFARIVMYAWGNCQALSRVIGADRENVHLQGVCHDLETNTRIGIEMDWPVQAPHEPTDQRWKDQINLAKRAGAAVALRNAIFGVIPQQFFKEITEEAKKVAVGEGKTFIESRNNAIVALKALGITQDMIYRALEVNGLESITVDDLIWLHAAMTSINEKTSTVAELFGNSTDPVKAQVPRPRGRPPKEVDLEPSRYEPATSERVPAKEEIKTTAPQAQAAVVPPPGPPEHSAEKVTAEPFPEPKSQKKKDLKLESAPAPVKPETAAMQIRSKLGEANLTEDGLLKWLDDLGTIPNGTVSLDTVNSKWLKMVLDDWDGISGQVRDFLGKQS